MTEAAILEVLALLPAESFIYQYVWWARGQVASPCGYHLGLAAGLVAQVMPSTFAVDGAFLTRALGNWWALVVGESGRAQKTLAVNLALELLNDVAPVARAPDPESVQALFKGLQRAPVQVLIYPEFSNFLHATLPGKGNIRAQLREVLTQLFDGIADARARVDQKPVVVVNPRLSVLAACTPKHLEDYLTTIDWDGGWMSRFAYFYAPACERSLRRPEPDTAGRRAWCSGWLRDALMQPAAPGACVGMTPAAQARWDAWLDDYQQLRTEDARLQGVLSRYPVVAARLAAIFAWDYGGARRGGEWQLGLDCIEPAVRLAEQHIRGAFALAQRISPSVAGRERKQLRNALELAVEQGTGPVPVGWLLARCDMGLRQAQQHLKSLEQMGQAVQVAGSDAREYWQWANGEIAPYRAPARLELAPVAAGSAGLGNGGQVLSFGR